MKNDVLFCPNKLVVVVVVAVEPKPILFWLLNKPVDGAVEPKVLVLVPEKSPPPVLAKLVAPPKSCCCCC